MLDALEDASLETRIMAIEGLGELGSESARLALLGIARDRWGYRPEIRIAALRSLGKSTGSARYADLLEDFIAGENRKVMSAARDMLRQVDPDGFPGRLLAKGCVDHAAIRVYGDTREKSAVPLLASFLEERMEAADLGSPRQWGKVFAAVRALGNIGGEDAAGALEGLLAWLDDEARPEATGLPGQRLDKVRQAAAESVSRARNV